MNLLIANIGNRNLRYKGEFIDTKLFRERTKFYWEHFDEEQTHLSPNIINYCIEQLGEQNVTVDQICLLASDQSSEHNHQDTLFEAKILEQLLKAQYGIDTTHKTFAANVADINQMVRTYRGYFRSLRNAFLEGQYSKLLYLDAGGTAQQKFACKIVIEYLFEREQIEMYYADPNKDGTSTLRTAELFEYRKVIDQETIAAAVNVNGYGAALELLSSSIPEKQNALKLIFEFSFARFLNLLDTASNLMKQLVTCKQTRDLSFVKEFANRLGKHADRFEETIGEKSYNHLCEIYSLAERHIQLKNHSQAVLYFQLFVENYLHAAIQKATKIDLSDNYDSKMKELERYVQANFDDWDKHFQEVDFKTSVSTLLKVGYFLTDNQDHQDAIASFMECFSRFNIEDIGKIKFLDTYRNSFTHKANAVPAKFEKEPYYPEILYWKELFGLPEENIYVKMNREIIQFMQ